MKLKTEIYIYIYLGSKIQEYTEWNPGSGINPEPGRESTYPRCSVSICLYLYSPGGGNVMCVCLYQKSVCKVTVPVCKAVRLAFSCQTSAISFPFIPIPWYSPVQSDPARLHLLHKTCWVDCSPCSPNGRVRMKAYIQYLLYRLLDWL